MKPKDSTQSEESGAYVTKTKPPAKALGTRKSCYAMKSKDSTQLEESGVYVTKTKPSAKALGTRKI